MEDKIENEQMKSALLGLVSFCKNSFISELTIDNFVRQCKLTIPNDEVSQIRLLRELANLCRRLPLALFNHDKAHLQKVLTGIESLIIKKSNYYEQNQNLKQPELSIFKQRKPKIKYI